MKRSNHSHQPCVKEGESCVLRHIYSSLKGSSKKKKKNSNEDAERNTTTKREEGLFKN